MTNRDRNSRPRLIILRYSRNREFATIAGVTNECVRAEGAEEPVDTNYLIVYPLDDGAAIIYRN